MSFPEYTISSPIVNVNVIPSSKILFLPPASTVIGQTFTIRDSTGAVFDPFYSPTRFIYLSTIGVDLFNNTTNLITFSIPYQSVKVYAQNTSNYCVIQNDQQGRFWLQ